ncbi:MAG: hypothetical protein PHH47_11125 [Gallionella sp.]|nr:hypothetical protein [Gallionella sp.]MDD4946992.1 hypothetical protein [Gallionella sp.]MDD5613019.1 hypothetical protein [Gallionella sp.]
MNGGKKFVLVVMDETDDTQVRLKQAGLSGAILAFESEQVSSRLFEAARELQEALANLHAFCNSTSIFLRIPTSILEQAERALRRARQEPW